MPGGPPCSPKATHNDQEDEVDEVVEGVCIHDKVHDVHPAFQRDDLVETGRENKPLKAQLQQCARAMFLLAGSRLTPHRRS